MTNNNIKNQETHIKVLKPGSYIELGTIAYPLIITNATHTLMQFIDRKFLAMYATEDVAAALPAGILAFTLFSFFQVTCGFTAAIVAQNYGRKNFITCARVPWAGFYFALIAGLICSFILSYLGNYFIDLGKHAPNILISEKAYFKMIMSSGLFIFINIAFSAFFSGRGKTWIIAIINFIATAINILLDYMFIFGTFGAPEMGITGAAFATMLSCIVGALLIFLCFLFQNQSKYPTRKNWLLNFSDIRRLITFGTPAGVQIFFSIGSFTFIIFLIGQLGVVQLAATTIALSVNMITFMPLIGISEAVSILSGKYTGLKKHKITTQVTYKALILSLVYVISISISYYFFAEYILNFFAPDQGSLTEDFKEVLEMGKLILICAALSSVFNAVRFVFIGSLTGAGDTRVPMFILIATSWLIIAPAEYFIIVIYKLNIIIVWIALILHRALIALLIYWRFHSGAWKSIDMLDKDSKTPSESSLLENLDYESDTPHL